MKKIFLSAGALLLSSSAVAAVRPDDSSAWTQQPMVMTDGTTAWTGQTMLQKTMMPQAAKQGTDFTSNMDKLAVTMAADTTLYENSEKAHMAVANLQTQMSGKDAMASKGEPAMNGMGGPEVATTYPPCDPGPGDDNCIQLYERGVSASYASWQQQNHTGMGGPYEPAEGEPMADDMSDMSKEAYWAALNNKLDAAKPATTISSSWGVPGTADHWAINQEVAPIRVATSFVDDAVVARQYATAEQIRALSAIEMTNAEYTGMGGPEESEYYPVCRSRSDDSCIQPGG